MSRHGEDSAIARATHDLAVAIAALTATVDTLAKALTLPTEAELDRMVARAEAAFLDPEATGANQYPSPAAEHEDNVASLDELPPRFS